MSETALSPREKQVCDLVVKGWTGQEIARSFGLSIRTVEDHRGNILKKYGCRNAVELVRAVYGIHEAAE